MDLKRCYRNSLNERMKILVERADEINYWGHLPGLPPKSMPMLDQKQTTSEMQNKTSNLTKKLVH